MKLTEDSIYSANATDNKRDRQVNNKDRKQQRDDSVDDLYDPSALHNNSDSPSDKFSQTALVSKLNQKMRHVQTQSRDTRSYINVTAEEDEGVNLSAALLRSQLQSKGGQQRSNFHDYVCRTLLEQIEKPIKVVNFEAKLSNPASPRILHKRQQRVAKQRGIGAKSIKSGSTALSHRSSQPGKQES